MDGGLFLLLEVLSTILAFLAPIVAFFSYAYAGSEDFDVLIVFGVGPPVATGFVYTSRLLPAAIAYFAAASALGFAAAFRPYWAGGVTVAAALIPLSLGLFSMALAWRRNRKAL